MKHAAAALHSFYFQQQRFISTAKRSPALSLMFAANKRESASGQIYAASHTAISVLAHSALVGALCESTITSTHTANEILHNVLLCFLRAYMSAKGF